MSKKDEFETICGGKVPRWKDCPECGAKLACKFEPNIYYGYEPRCKKCQRKKDAEEQKKQGVEARQKSFYLGSTKKDVVAFGVEKATGRTVGITEKGEHVDPSQTRYDLKRDPKGWRTAGKKVRERDQFGNQNY